MSRIKKSLLNAKVGLFFYAITIFVSFFSRKMFLEYLGDDFIGLTSVLMDILKFLNIAELGVSTAIGYALYKPLFDDDHDEINRLIQYFGHLYRKIGLIILGLSLLVALFFPIFFADVNFSLPLIYYAFFTFVISSLIGYFLNYHLTLFEADQKEYLITQYFQTASILKSLLQIALVYLYTNYYLWITIELLFAIALAIILRWRVKATYPWLKTGLDRKFRHIKYPEIFTKIKQIFIHKIAFFILIGTDQILIFKFVNLESVAFFSNYNLICNYSRALINTSLKGTQASIGNLIAENNFENTQKVFWEMMSVRQFTGGFLFITLFFLTDTFIELWLGEKYILDNLILILMCANIYIGQIRLPVSNFINGYGLFSDTWAPIAEAILNIGLSILLGMQYGIVGILLGTLISTFLIVVLWKPFYLYKRGFKINVNLYWIGFLKLFVSFIIAFFIIEFFNQMVLKSEITNFLEWILYALKISVVSLLVYSILLYMLNQGFRNFVQRIRYIIFKN